MEWLATSERLPEVEPCGEPGCEWCGTGKCCNSVLALYPVGYMDAGSRFQVCATAYMRGPYSHGEITHWMPLPSPPKEED